MNYREMWEYLDHIGTFLTNIGRILKTLPSSQKGLVRQGLSSATRRYGLSNHARRRVTIPKSESKAIPFITGDNGQLLPGKIYASFFYYYLMMWTYHLVIHLTTGVLLYFSDGVLPFLAAYYRFFFEPPENLYIREKRMAISSRIATALLVSNIHLLVTFMICQNYFRLSAQ